MLVVASKASFVIVPPLLAEPNSVLELSKRLRPPTCKASNADCASVLAWLIAPVDLASKSVMAFWRSVTSLATAPLAVAIASALAVSA